MFLLIGDNTINTWRDLKRKEEREISLDHLMSERHFEPSAMDSYFEKQDKPTVFLVLGKKVIVDDEQLATALSRLPQLRQEILLLYYFIGYRDEAIGRLYGRCRSSINRHESATINTGKSRLFTTRKGAKTMSEKRRVICIQIYRYFW